MDREEQRPAQCVAPGAVAAVDELHYLGDRNPLQWACRLTLAAARYAVDPTVMWSQLPTRGKVQQRDTGIVDWDVQRDPPAAAQLREIIPDGVR